MSTIMLLKCTLLIISKNSWKVDKVPDLTKFSEEFNGEMETEARISPALVLCSFHYIVLLLIIVSNCHYNFYKHDSCLMSQPCSPGKIVSIEPVSQTNQI